MRRSRSPIKGRSSGTTDTRRASYHDRRVGAARAQVAAGTGLAVLGAAHAALNSRLLRRPDLDPPPAAGRVSVLLPVRDEARRVEACLRALLAQERVPDLEVVVLDDGSTDGTADIVRRVVAEDPGDCRVVLATGAPLPDGWLGKPHACASLVTAADPAAGVYVFVDADVVLRPRAVAATVALLRERRLDLVSPYPRQLAETAAERLVQPLLQWSWLTFLPLRLAETSGRQSLAAANGQLLAVTATAYRRSGGHGSPAVRAAVVEDVALLRALKRSGGRGVVADGTDLATTRMYDGWASLREGYTKSLHDVFGSPAGAAGVGALLGLAYLVPPVAALGGSRVGALGYAAGVGGRVVTARRTGGRALPDALAHPASVAALLGLTASSLHRRRAGTLTWKGRPV
jgi:hypothetical protein